MKRVLIFAGTTEGRILAEKLSKYTDKITLFVSVATKYGSELLDDITGISVSDKRLDCEQMQEYIRENCIDLVVDATHPYAVDVTKNVKTACEETNTTMVRLLRENNTVVENDDIVYVDNISQAVEFLQATTGNILLTIGSKELKAFTQIDDYQNRIFARVLPFSHVVKECEDLGFKGKNLICMQGPFSTGFNEEMLKMLDAKYMLTKESGATGGFDEKIQSILKIGCKAVIIKRPMEETGFDIETVEKIILGGE